MLREKPRGKLATRLVNSFCPRSTPCGRELIQKALSLWKQLPTPLFPSLSLPLSPSKSRFRFNLRFCNFPSHLKQPNSIIFRAVAFSSLKFSRQTDSSSSFRSRFRSESGFPKLVVLIVFITESVCSPTSFAFLVSRYLFLLFLCHFSTWSFICLRHCSQTFKQFKRPVQAIWREKLSKEIETKDI